MSVAFIPDDTRNWGLPVASPSLLLDVPRALHFEGAHPYCLRLMQARTGQDVATGAKG